MVIWTERIFEISLESVIFGFFGDFGKFLKINNSRTAEDMKKYWYLQLSAERVDSEKMVVFFNLSRI